MVVGSYIALQKAGVALGYRQLQSVAKCRELLVGTKSYTCCLDQTKGKVESLVNFQYSPRSKHIYRSGTES